MTEHTPGPWDWHNDQIVWHGGMVTSKWWVLGPGILIADGTDGTPGGDKIDQANARLIAAAPELLEALEAISSLEEKTRASADPGDWESNWDLLQEIFAAADAAITKAKGEK